MTAIAFAAPLRNLQEIDALARTAWSAATPTQPTGLTTGSPNYSRVARMARMALLNWRYLADAWRRRPGWLFWQVSRMPPTEPATHLVLASLDAQFAAMATELDAALVSGPEQWRRLWQRDRGILKLARSAQAKRLTRAAAVFTLAPEGDARSD